MKSEKLWLVLLCLGVLTCAAIAVAGPTKGDPWKPPPPEEVDLPIFNKCMSDCCESSSGTPMWTETGYVCHFDDNNPNLNEVLAMFDSCKKAC